eukprot:10665609-Heterocapsa_arctica.AAC.1
MAWPARPHAGELHWTGERRGEAGGEPLQGHEDEGRWGLHVEKPGLLLGAGLPGNQSDGLRGLQAARGAGRLEWQQLCQVDP